MLYRKKAKNSKTATTEAITDNVNNSSIDMNNKQESDAVEKESENDMPMSQCQPMLISQSGKFIPRFMAKKKMGDCVVKLECATKMEWSDSCSVLVSEAETSVKSQPCSTGTLAAEVNDDSGCACSEAVTDTHNDNEPGFTECMDGQVANEQTTSSSEQCTSPNNGSTESIGSNKEQAPVGTILLAIDMQVSQQSNARDCECSTNVEEKENCTLNGDVCEIQQCLNSATTNVDGAAKPLSVESSSNVKTEASECTLAAETVPVAHEDCTETETLLSAALENNQHPEETDETMNSSSSSRARDDDTATASVTMDLNPSNSNHSDSVVVAENCSNISLVLETVDAAVGTCLDAMSNDGNERKAVINNGAENSSNRSETDLYEVSCETESETGVSCVPVSAANEAETGKDMEESTESEASVCIAETSEPPLFDDFLDLTDSQLCELDVYR